MIEISVQQTCKEWKEIGLEDNTEVVIHPSDDVGPFWVHCDVDILNGTGVTMICKFSLSSKDTLKQFEINVNWRMSLLY